MTLPFWKPVNFDRWLCLARDDLGELFVPSGPPGTHAHRHFHAPADPGAQERVLNACAADYETFLVASKSRSSCRPGASAGQPG